MKIYIACLWDDRAKAQSLAAFLSAAGHVVTSRWLWMEYQPAVEASVMDVEDVMSAEVLVLMTLPLGTPHCGGGRHFEFGMAWQSGRRCFILGEREHVFCHLPERVSVCGDREALLEALAAAQREDERTGLRLATGAT